MTEVCANGMCVAIHRNDKCYALLKSFMPCIAGKYLRHRNASDYYKALIFSLLLYFCIKAKESKTKLYI
jgi:hypothetical protein